MPRAKKVQPTPEPESPVVEASTEPTPPVVFTKADYLKARATIKSYREAQRSKPKRPCSEKQLAALAAGREKNTRCKKKTEQTKPQESQ